MLLLVRLAALTGSKVGLGGVLELLGVLLHLDLVLLVKGSGDGLDLVLAGSFCEHFELVLHPDLDLLVLGLLHDLHRGVLIAGDRLHADP